MQDSQPVITQGPVDLNESSFFLTNFKIRHFFFTRLIAAYHCCYGNLTVSVEFLTM